jgi:hypothetical protein
MVRLESARTSLRYTPGKPCATKRYEAALRIVQPQSHSRTTIRTGAAGTWLTSESLALSRRFFQMWVMKHLGQPASRMFYGRANPFNGFDYGSSLDFARQLVCHDRDRLDTFDSLGKNLSHNRLVILGSKGTYHAIFPPERTPPILVEKLGRVKCGLPKTFEQKTCGSERG